MKAEKMDENKIQTMNSKTSHRCSTTHNYDMYPQNNQLTLAEKSRRTQVIRQDVIGGIECGRSRCSAPTHARPTPRCCRTSSRGTPTRCCC